MHVCVCARACVCAFVRVWMHHRFPSRHVSVRAGACGCMGVDVPTGGLPAHRSMMDPLVPRFASWCAECAAVSLFLGIQIPIPALALSALCRVPCALRMPLVPSAPLRLHVPATPNT